jgi:hypothetical protein
MTKQSLTSSPNPHQKVQCLNKEMLAARWGSVASKAESTEAKNWPLHVKHTGRLDWKALDAMIHPTLREAWQKHAQYFAITSALLGSEFNIDSSASLEEGDIEELIAKKYVEKASRVRGTVRVFWVAELLKKRRRLVTHPREQNELPFQREPNLFPSDAEVFGGGTAATAACIDMTAFFNQFSLPEYLRDFFCFRT